MDDNDDLIVFNENAQQYQEENKDDIDDPECIEGPTESEASQPTVLENDVKALLKEIEEKLAKPSPSFHGALRQTESIEKKRYPERQHHLRPVISEQQKTVADHVFDKIKDFENHKKPYKYFDMYMIVPKFISLGMIQKFFISQID